MHQQQLPFYDLTANVLWGSKWTMPKPELFTALLLELGPPHADNLFGERSYYNTTVAALEKWFNPLCPVPIELCTREAVSMFLDWCEERGYFRPTI